MPVLPDVGARHVSDDRPRVRSPRQGQARLQRPCLRGPRLASGHADGRGRGTSGEDVERRRAPLSQPGRRELGLGHGRAPATGRSFGAGAGHREDDGRSHVAAGGERACRLSVRRAVGRHLLDTDVRGRPHRRVDDAATRRHLRRRVPSGPGRLAPPMTEGRLRAAVGALALAGAAVAAYLTVVRYSGEALYCVAGGCGCETVQRSRYAELAGIPVAALGLGAYVALFVTALVRGPTAAAIGAGIALAGVGFSAWLLYAQLVLIDAICQWCIANDVILTLAAMAAMWRLRQSTEADQQSHRWRQ